MNPLHSIFLAQDHIADLYRNLDPHVGEHRASGVVTAGRLGRLVAAFSAFARRPARSSQPVVH